MLWLRECVYVVVERECVYVVVVRERERMCVCGYLGLSGVFTQQVLIWLNSSPLFVSLREKGKHACPSEGHS